jgi:hypothetical protein
MAGKVRRLLDDVISGVVVGLVGLAIGRAWPAVQGRWQHRKARAFWHSLADGGAIAVLDSHTSPTMTNYEPTGMTGIADVQANALLQARLKEMGFDVRVRHGADLSEEEKHGNLLLLGSADSNRISAQVFKSSNLPLTFRDDDEAIVDTRGNGVWEAIRDNGEVVRDFGLLIVARNPYDARRRAFVFAGIFGWATQAAVIIATDPEYLRSLPKDHDFVCLVECEVRAGNALPPRILSTSEF